MFSRKLSFIGAVIAGFSIAMAADPEPAAPAKPSDDEPPIVEGMAHYIVYREPREGMIRYSTFQFPDLGYLSAQPDFVVQEIRDVKLNQARIITKDQPGQPARQKIQHAISIRLSDQDTERLKELSKKATGQRVLIVIDGRPVSAPVIMAPIESGEITISGGRLSLEAVNRIVADLQKRVATK